MNILGFQVQRISNRVLLDSMRDRKDMLAMQALAPLSSGYLPWSQAAMRPSGLVAVLNDIVINNRSSVVECGGGVSTFYIARLLKSRGGHIFSIENDETWANLLQKSLDDEGLHEQATVVYAPLTKTQYSWDGAQWYDEKKLAPIIAGPKVDLLLVDGP